MSGYDCELCECGDGYYDPFEHRSCYNCYLERREDHVECIWCGRWHSPRYATCYECRGRSERDEAARNLRLDILIRDDFTCRHCGDRTCPEVDHIKPCAKGGEATPWNLQVLCRTCNTNKWDTWWPGCRWDRTRIELMHLYFTFSWTLLDEDERAELRLDASSYGDEFTFRAHYKDTLADPPQWAIDLADADTP
jgi:5-methylcytosine-specific restriction endonuclease McrA